MLTLDDFIEAGACPCGGSWNRPLQAGDARGAGGRSSRLVEMPEVKYPGLNRMAEELSRILNKHPAAVRNTILRATSSTCLRTSRLRSFSQFLRRMKMEYDADVIERFCEAVEAFREWWIKNGAKKMLPSSERDRAGATPAGSK